MITPEVLHIEPGCAPVFPVHRWPIERTFVLNPKRMSGDLYADFELVGIKDRQVHQDEVCVPWVDAHAGVFEFIIQRMVQGELFVADRAGVRTPREIAKMLITLRTDNPSEIGVLFTVKDVPSSVWLRRNPSTGGHLEERSL